MERVIRSLGNVNYLIRGVFSPLLDAISKNDINAVEILLNYDADPNLDNGITSPLIFAIEKGNNEIIDELILSGADVNRIVGGNNALGMSIKLRNIELFEKLFYDGAKPIVAIDGNIYPLMTYLTQYVPELLKVINKKTLKQSLRHQLQQRPPIKNLQGGPEYMVAENRFYGNNKNLQRLKQLGY